MRRQSEERHERVWNNLGVCPTGTCYSGKAAENAKMTKVEKERIKRAIDTYTQKVTKSPSKAKAALTKSGIYQPDGKLAPEYKEQEAA